MQEAINQAHKQKKEVWVAKGTYYPTTTNDKNVSFQMKEGVSSYGGFIGDETKREQRDWVKNLTILNGGRENSNINSYHVVIAASNMVLDGFIITGGRAVPTKTDKSQSKLGAGGQHADFKNLLKGSKNQMGGGLLIVGNNPTIRNCMFVGNKAQKGGAVYQISSYKRPQHPSGSAKRKTSMRTGNDVMTLDQWITLFQKKMVKKNAPIFDHVIFIDNVGF